MSTPNAYGAFSGCRCGKRTFLNRRQARKFARSIFPGEHMSAYRCPLSVGWHIGHLPPEVLHGVASRADVTGPHTFVAPAPRGGGFAA